MATESLSSTDDFSSGMERAQSQAIHCLDYTEKLERLMQKARINHEERRAYAILYAVNIKLKSKIIRAYIFADLSLSVSVKGESRKELLDVIKYGSGQVPRGLFGRIKETFGIESD